MKNFWYLYILLLVSLSGGRMIERILSESGGFSSRYLPLIATVLISIGIYGCMNNKPVLKRWVWRTVFTSTAFLSLAALVFSAYLVIFVGGSSVTSVGLLLLVVIILIPAQIKLRKYYLKSSGYW